MKVRPCLIRDRDCLPFTSISVHPSRASRFTLHGHLGSPSRASRFTLHGHLGSPFTGISVHPSWAYRFTLHEHLGSPFTGISVHPSRASRFTHGFWWVMLLILLVCCVVFCFALFVFVFCLVYPMLPVSLD